MICDQCYTDVRRRVRCHDCHQYECPDCYRNCHRSGLKRGAQLVPRFTPSVRHPRAPRSSFPWLQVPCPVCRAPARHHCVTRVGTIMTGNGHLVRKLAARQSGVPSTGPWHVQGKLTSQIFTK